MSSDHPVVWEAPAFQSIVKATADKAGEEFFRHLVKHLALALDVGYAFVAEFAGSPARVRTVGLWGNGGWLDNLEYDLDGTPCEEVLGGALCFHPDGLQERFPRDTMLGEMGARSFLGVPLRAVNGDTLGHLAIIDTKPIAKDAKFQAIFELFADRARVELERLRAHAALERAGRELEFRLERTTRDLQLAREQLATLVEIQRAVAGRLDRKALFHAVAEALQGVIPVDRVILVLPGNDPATLIVYAAHGKTGTRFFEGETIPRAGTIPGWVVEHGRPMVVARAADIRGTFPVSYEKLQQEAMDSVAVVPLLTEGRCVGALSLMAEPPEAWSVVPPRMLEEIAASVAVAVDSSVAYEQLGQVSDELGALAEVNKAVARHLRRDELFAALGQCLRGILPSDRFGIELPVPGDRLRGHVFSPGRGVGGPTQVDDLPAAGTVCGWAKDHRQWFVSASRAELLESFPVTHRVMEREGMESLCTLPLLSGERCIGVLFFMAAQEGAYQQLRRGLLDQVAGAVAVALDNCLAYAELRNLRDRLASENVYLQEEIRQEHDFREIVGHSPALLEVLSRVEAVARTDSTVVILGETGTGKELIARALHDRSRRRERPLVKVNCSAISAGLVESELFGHVKGAFTGAVANRPGRFELADGGTIFLDEVGDLPLDTQVKLLRVLQEREFEPVGSSQTRKVDVRVIAATNRDLSRAVEVGTFRADLFYRLHVLPIHLPPLRERREDIPLLVLYFLERHRRELGKPLKGVAPETMKRLTAYDWPGNIRELQNLMERVAILATGPVIELGPEFGPAPPPPEEAPVPATRARSAGSLVEVERDHILSVLRQSRGVIEGPQGAARVLAMHPNTLRSRMKKLGIRRPDHAIS
ncbi:MAG TPA: sigma 54-interacting transcriptional regulator [Candidatus Polarisedimenticolaceae bacterium]|nr:sigma 54-interacting transcriptional regulator [Candidatus Polarisedimenticolaceae bacterium]